MRFLLKLFNSLLKTIIWAILLLIVLVIVLYFSAGKLIQHFAPDFISKVTQTETALGEVDVSLFSGKIAVHDLAIGNPSGYKDKNIFQLGKVAVEYDPKSILTNKIIINKVQLSGLGVSSEVNAQGKTNISQLIDNINDFVGSDASKPEQKAPQANQQAPQKGNTDSSVVIRDLIIEDASVRAGVAGQITTIPLPIIHQQNIGEQKEQTLLQTVQSLIALIGSESAKATVNATKDAAKNVIDTGKGTLKGLKDSFKGLF